jgi:hypothetical protein
MDEDAKGEKVTIRAWYRRPQAVIPLDFSPRVASKPPSMPMRYAALAAAHDQVWSEEDDKIGRSAPLAAVLNVLGEGWYYGNRYRRYLWMKERGLSYALGLDFDPGVLKCLRQFYRTVKADLSTEPADKNTPDGAGSAERDGKAAPGAPAAPPPDRCVLMTKTEIAARILNRRRIKDVRPREIAQKLAKCLLKDEGNGKWSIRLDVPDTLSADELERLRMPEWPPSPKVK